MTTRDEQETTVTYNRGHKLAYIYTASPADMRALLAEPRFTLTKEHKDDTGNTEAIEGTVPTEQLRPLTFKKQRQPLTDEQREALVTRTAKARAARAKDTPASI